MPEPAGTGRRPAPRTLERRRRLHSGRTRQKSAAALDASFAPRRARSEFAATTRPGDSLLPPIPRRLREIDAATAGEHSSLDSSDRCYYVWEYTARQGYDFSVVNRLISNLKMKPTRIASRPDCEAVKRQAVRHAAAALRELIERPWVEGRLTFVPMPPSKAFDHPDHDDRMLRILAAAFTGFDADIRAMLEQTSSTRADHERRERLRLAELRAILRLDEAAVSAAPRPVIAIVDDVLTSGKHFRVARELLSRRFPRTAVIGIFIARRARSGAHP